MSSVGWGWIHGMAMLVGLGFLVSVCADFPENYLPTAPVKQVLLPFFTSLCCVSCYVAQITSLHQAFNVLSQWKAVLERPHCLPQLPCLIPQATVKRSPPDLQIGSDAPFEISRCSFASGQHPWDPGPWGPLPCLWAHTLTVSSPCTLT